MQTETQPEVRRKRRWWLYLLVGVGSLFLLGLLAVALIAGYFNSLVKRYTQSAPTPLPALEASAQSLQQLTNKWLNFQQMLVDPRRSPEPLQLSADELNLFLSAIRDLKDHLHLFIEGDQLKAKFSFPAGKRGSKLRDKYINGEATLRLQLENGFLTLHVAEMKANNQPIPGWLLKRLQKQNLVSFLDQNLDALDLFQRLESIEVADGFVTLTPAYDL